MDIRVEIRDIQRPYFDWPDSRGSVSPEILEPPRAAAVTWDPEYDYPEFKDDVGAALRARFGPGPAVERGDTVFDIHDSRYRVDADCLPAVRWALAV